MEQLDILLSTQQYENCERVRKDVLEVLYQPVGPVWRAWTMSTEDSQTCSLLTLHGGLTVKYRSEKIILPVRMTLPRSYPEQGPVIRLRCSRELTNDGIPVVYVSEAWADAILQPKQIWNSASSTLLDSLCLNVDDSLLDDLQEVMEAQVHSAARDGNVQVLEVLARRENELRRMRGKRNNIDARSQLATDDTDEPFMINIAGSHTYPDKGFCAFRQTSDKYQKTAVHVAVEFGQIEIVCYLLERDYILCCRSPSTEVQLSLLRAFSQPVWQREVQLMEKVLASATSWAGEYNRGFPPAWLYAADTENDIEHTLWTLMEVGASMQFGQNYILPEAATKGYSLVVAELIDWDADVNHNFTLSGERLLRLATTADHVPTMHLLINHGADMEEMNRFSKDSALHCAQSAEAAVDLLARGCDVNARNHDHRTPLATVTDIGALQVLISHGADINATDRSNSVPLHVHVRRTDDHAVERVQLFLSLGVKPNIADQYGCTALHYITLFDSSNYSDQSNRVRASIAQVLLNAGADVDARNHADFSALHFAARQCYVALVDVLLSTPGVQVNGRGEDGRGVWHFFAHYSCLGDNHSRSCLADRLLAAGADVNMKDNLGRTALHESFEGVHSNADYALVVKRGFPMTAINVNEQDNKGQTALHYAAIRNAATIVRFLLEHGANTSIVDHAGHTAAHYAHGEDLKFQLTKRSAEEEPEEKRPSKMGKL